MDEFKNDPNIEDINLQQKIPGKNLFHAPQGALTAADETAFPHSTNADSITSAGITTLNNMRTRIDQIEAALIKLGFLRHI